MPAISPPCHPPATPVTAVADNDIVFFAIVLQEVRPRRKIDGEHSTKACIKPQ
ncbi:MAG: hypothetical protein OEL83_13765 [Desulforhopalus sp.]|nr:hypothetical protein [Desulforhopalus sp.]